MKSFRNYNHLLNYYDEYSLIFYCKTLYFTKYMYMLSDDQDIRIFRPFLNYILFIIIIYINLAIYFSGIVPDYINTIVRDNITDPLFLVTTSLNVVNLFTGTW